MPRKWIPLLVVAMGMVSFTSGPAEAAATDRPNFIQILTDDQGWGDLGSFGHQFIQTPHIDQLAAEGIKFTHAYSGGSVCSPSVGNSRGSPV